jgi:predicted phage gp36 major capsid-like protein
MQGEQGRVAELYEDAIAVREELMRELKALEKAKRKAKRKNAAGKVGGEKKNAAAAENKVSIAISRAESLLSLSGDGIGARIEELIEEKSRSIVNVITQN